MISFIKKFIVDFFLSLIFLPIFIFLSFITKQKRNKKYKPRLVFGHTPLINNKYWSKSLQEIGFKSRTLMRTFYNINKKEDFDIYFDDFNFTKIKFLDLIIRPYFIFIYVLCNFDIIHISFDGGFLFNNIYLKYLEPYIYKFANIKLIVIPYGKDAYIYSRIIDQSIKHTLLINYPQNGRDEKKIKKQVEFFIQKSDFVMGGLMTLDGFSRWDILPVNFIIIDEKNWRFIENNSKNNGINGFVSIVHTPNHRGCKGTEFLIQAVEDLKKEGLKIELKLLEKVSNDKVKEIIQNSDILAEQFIFIGYALSAIEGMATGLPVLSNITDERYTTLFKRYSYLNECPIVPTSPENLKENLRKLITNPELRHELGKKGREYVEKYHSYTTAQLMFLRIYDKIWYKKDIDLINYFHPIIGKYNEDYEKYKNHELSLTV